MHSRIRPESGQNRPNLDDLRKHFSSETGHNQASTRWLDYSVEGIMAIESMLQCVLWRRFVLLVRRD